MTFLPVGMEPVKLILSMPSCSVMSPPSSPPPFMAWSTPGGRKLWQSSANLRTQYGVKGEGFMMTVFPMTRADTTLMLLRISCYKLHVRTESLGHLGQQLLSLLSRGRSPAWKRRASSGDSIFEVL
ncbi:hypothetical protein PoMZ_07891 [Pyricularia oryzae]|uniref:Uncharacterized protein n=1 Tax=Pyricularia oryzae TaxID=318829 RepID=A0A4P7NG98_PYROR|nr:hypothetical protein PoMZ_07891 [Pyricularia oryzae]